MSNLDPSLTRVSFEIPDEYVDQLLAQVADFAISHALMTVVEPVAPPRIEAETPLTFDQRWTTILKDPVEGDVVIIGPLHMREFSAEQTGSSMSGNLWSKAIAQVADNLSEKSDIYPEYLKKCKEWEPYLYGQYVRATKAQELAQRLKDDTMPKIPGIGAINIGLFCALAENLVVQAAENSE